MEQEISMHEEDITKIEARAIELYIEDIYSKKVPEPVAPTSKDLSFWKIAGIEATLFTLAGIAVAIYSAIRTGGLFFIMETMLLREFNLDPSLIGTFSFGAMITSLGAFELYVLADGFSKGRENKNLKRSDVGLYSSLGVIVLAGIFTGLGLVPQLSEGFKVVFYTITAVSTAVAGGLVALYSGENIGFTVLKVEKVREKLIKNHAENHLKWKEGAIKSYQTSRYAIGSKKSNEFIENVSRAKKIYSKDIQEKEKPEKEIDFSEYIPSDSTFTIYNNIVKFVKKNGRIPKTKELSFFGKDEIKVNVALSKYIVTNEKQLLSNNIVTNSIVDKARTYFENNKAYDY